MLHSRQRTTRIKLGYEKQFTRIQKMKKVRVEWVETHCYEAEIEVPDGLSNEDEMDWVINNKFEWDTGLREPYEINTDWDGFEIYEVDE